MTEITFITSNQTKVVHARYLCKGYNVSILKYKRFFYGVGYHEPQIFDREILLKESFNDAVSRWRKHVSNYGERLFFIEDTSVKIDALSCDGKEVPGVDIKYWMQANDFETLDKALRERGNNRAASVSSHIMLFLTDPLKARLGTSEMYKIFHSTAKGSIVEKELIFDTQLLYPWLDNKSFNKWFVPEGFSSPISTLSIEDADKGDFRKGAFQQMLAFLKDNGQLKESPTPIFDWKLQFDDIYIICGPTCSGKSTIGQYLVNRYGYYHIEASDFMSLRYHETHGTISSVDKHLFAAEVLKVEPLYVVDRVLEYIHSHGIYDKLVITGFRTQSEVESFLNRYHSTRIKCIYLNADENIRYERWIRRKRDVDAYTRDRFVEIDHVQDEMGVRSITAIAAMESLDNSIEGKDLFYNKFAISFRNGMKQVEYPDIKKIVLTEKMPLEKAIMITLAISHQEDETLYLTTTEISKRINELFDQFSKNKNNVSRYFNQAYYLYYEIKKEGRKVKYKISPVGYSEALLFMRNCL